MTQRTTHASDSPSHFLRAFARVIAFAIGLVAIILIVLWIRQPNADQEEAAQADLLIPVEVITVAAMTLDETVRGIGTLKANAAVTITPEIGGRVRGIHFTEGERVESGDLLIELDDDKIRRQIAAREAALRAVEARLGNARRTFARQEELVDVGAVSQDAFDQAQADLETALADHDQAEAQLELAREELTDTRIRAPFAGAISERQVDPGAFVGMGDPLARLYDSDPLEIVFSVPERYLGRVEREQDVAVTVAAFPQRPFSGKVDFISPAVEEGTRSVLVKAVVKNPDGELTPGSFATAIVTIDRRQNQPVVPEEALVATRAGYSVFVVEDQIASLREVATGLRLDGMVGIPEGLRLGETVVRLGQMRLSDGDRVQITHHADDPADSPSRATGLATGGS